MCFLIQHCQLWFERYPSDPVHLLKTSVEVIICKESLNLYKHFEKQGFGVTQYAWPMLKNCFSVVLPKEDWLKLLDHLFTYHNKPELLFYFTAAYLLHFKGTLSKIKSIEKMYEFVQTQNPVDMKIVIREMFRLHKKYTDDEEVYMGTFGNYLPINDSNGYPAFTNYPADSVNHAQKIRLLKLDEEKQAEQKEKEITQIRERVSKLLLKEKHERDQAQAIAEFDIQKYHENKRDLEQQILDKLNEQDQRTEYLRQLEQTLKVAITNQEQQRILDKQRITSEYDERRRLSEYEHKARVQEEQLKNMEHKATQRVLEMIAIREKEDYQRQLNLQANYKVLEEETRDKAMMEKWKLEDEERKLRAELQLREKQRHREHQVFEYDKQRLEMQHKLSELEKELYVVQLEKERKLRQAEEDFMFAANKLKQEACKKNEYLEILEQNGIHELTARNKAIVDMTDDRIKMICRQKQEIEEALEFERLEQLRLQKAVDKKKFEEELMNIKLMEEAKRRDEDRQIEAITNAMEQEKRERMKANNQFYYKEKEILEREKFHELLTTTDDNLMKIEEEQLEKTNMKFKKTVDEALQKAKEDRENKLREIVRDRELNFQAYTLQRQNQIHEEYRKKFEQHKDVMNESNSMIGNFEKQNLLSPERDFKSMKKRTKSEFASPESENMSPNYQYGPTSELSCSINQKYLNKDVYNVSRSQTQLTGYPSQTLDKRGALMQSNPYSDNLNGSRTEINVDGESGDERSFVGSREEDDEALRKHEQSKHAFDSYMRSFQQQRVGYSCEGGVLPLKESTFGMPSQSSQEFQKYGMTYSVPYGSMEDIPLSDNQETRSHYPHKGGVFSNFSSPITEEDEGESSLSFTEGQEMSMTSRGSNSYYSKRPQNIYNEHSYMHNDQLNMKSPSVNDHSTSSYENTSDISSSEGTEVNRSQYNHAINDLGVNPFYRPNPTFAQTREWR